MQHNMMFALMHSRLSMVFWHSKNGASYLVASLNLHVREQASMTIYFEDGQCHPTGPCPDGHHYEDEDESGQCYPNDEGCGDYGPFVLIEEEDGGDRCALLYYICDEAEHSSKDYCIEYCKENPERSVCNRTE
jgi:hypothetical protein